MSDERKSPGKVEEKTRRDKRLAEALRANLRRRKAPETAGKTTAGSQSSEPAKGSPGGGQGA